MSESRSCYSYVEISYFLSLGLYKFRIPFRSVWLLKMRLFLAALKEGKKQHIYHPMGC